MEALSRFLIIANYDKDNKLLLSKAIKEYIEEKGGEAFVSYEEKDYDGGIMREDIIKNVQCIIVLGGDGTMLRASHILGEHEVYMIGVNLGTLGFLTEIDKNHVNEMIDRLMSGEYSVEDRMMIQGEIKKSGVTHNALNDIVLSRLGILRIIAFDVYVNDKFIDTYKADGIIISTPTGSTGYNLSCGGPIISPSARLIALTPISPHSLSKKPVILGEDDEIRIELKERNKTQKDEAILSFDGYENYELSAGDSIVIKKSARSIKLAKIYDVNFYEVLRSKMGEN